MVGEEAVRLAHQPMEEGLLVTPAMSSCRSKGSVAHRQVLGQTLLHPRKDSGRLPWGLTVETTPGRA